MKFIVLLLFVLVTFSLEAQAAAHGDMRVLKEADRIRFDINRLSKNYLVYYMYPKKIYFKNTLQKLLESLSDDMRSLAISTKDKKTKDILKYFAYEQIQIEELIQKKPTAQIAKDLISISESFAEGTTEIVRRHQYTPTPEEEMWFLTRSMKYDIEEVLKYYLARNVTKKDTKIIKKMHRSISHFSQSLAQINQYSYSGDLRTTTRRMNAFWKVLQLHFGKTKTPLLPLISVLGGDDLEESITLLGLYHSTNQ